MPIVSPSGGGSGGSQPVVTVISLNWDAPNFVNPPGDFKVVYQPDAGTLFEFFYIITNQFDGNPSEWFVGMFPRGDQSGESVFSGSYDFQVSNGQVNTVGAFELQAKSQNLPVLAASRRPHALAFVDADFVVGLNSEFLPSEGEGNLYIVEWAT